MTEAFTNFDNWFAGRSIATSAGFFLPHLKPGMRLLDCGCGPGSITLDFAEALAPGEVIGVDAADYAIERAKGALAERKLANVSFQQGDIFALDFPDNSFDAVWCSSVLQWLVGPQRAISEMLRVLKPGGVFGSRDRAGRSDVFGNANALVLRGWRLHYRLVTGYGFDARLGEKLRSMLLRSGFETVVTGASFENRGTQEGARFIANLYKVHVEEKNAVDEIVSLGWATREELARIVAAWNAWGEDPRSFYSMARIETVAWKPQ